jgi:hypothetical protein
VRNLIFGIPLLFACSEYELSERELGDVFYQLDAGAVDVLLVVDNSCSMQPYQEELANNFDAFLTYFIEGDVDYQIGVTTTTMTEVGPYPEGGCYQSDVDRIPAPGNLVDGAIVNEDTENASGLFSTLVSVGTCGSGSEMGLEAALRVLENPNSELLREDAYLSVIFVSDEQDASPMPVNDYINAMRAVKDETARQVYNASSLVVTDSSACNTTQIASGATEGSRYVDVADQSSGVKVNICSDNFADIVTDLSLASSRLNDIFFLTNTPAVDTLLIEIDIDGESGIYNCDSEKYPWIYEEVEVDGEQAPIIRFERSKLPPVNAKIAIQYNVAHGSQDFSCGE